MKQDFSIVLSLVSRYSARPPLFEPGEARFWNDPHISGSMLEAHLNPEHDAASRRPETIDREVKHLLVSRILKPGDRVLDLGCGPGLYSHRLSRAGLRVTGVDTSESSLNYAIAQARNEGLEIEYRCMNFFDIGYDSEFDAVIQTYGEFNTISDEKLDLLLNKIHQALKPGGLLVFDVSTRSQRKKVELKNIWYFGDGGFWRPGRHLVLEQAVDYPEHDVWLDQNIVIDENNISGYRNWFHDYTLPAIDSVLLKAGFQTIQAWNDLTGTAYKEGGDWIAIAAKRV